MVRHSNTWVFNISPENWDSCSSGPVDGDFHGNENVGEPWHGLSTSARNKPDGLNRGDLVLARRTSGSGDPYGVLGIWRFHKAQKIRDQSNVPWKDAKYEYVLYCRPIQRELDEIYTEPWDQVSFTTHNLQGAITSLQPEHRDDYFQELLDHAGTNEDVRAVLKSQLEGTADLTDFFRTESHADVDLQQSTEQSDLLNIETPSIGQRFNQEAIEQWFNTGFGYQISGINPRRTEEGDRFVLLFSQEDGPYEDNIGDGEFEYIGEGMPENGDQSTSSSGNSVLIDAVDESIPIFFFYKGTDDQEWEYRGLVDVVEWNWQTNPEAKREEIVFSMQMHTEEDDLDSDDKSSLSGELYLIPVSDGWLPQFNQTVMSALSLELVADVPQSLRDISADRIWGTTATESKKKQKHAEEMDTGDHILFYHDGDFIGTGIVGSTFIDREIGEFIWDNPDSKYIFTVEDFSTETPSIQRVWEELGYDGQPVVSGFQRVASHRLENLSAETISKL